MGSSGGTTPGRLQDLSAGGLCLLVTTRSVDVGAELYLGIFFRGPLNDPLVVVANVLRCTPVDGGFHLGLQFVSDNPAQREALDTVRQHLRDRHGQ